MAHELVLLSGGLGLVLVITNVLLDQPGLPVPALPTLIVAGATGMSWLRFILYSAMGAALWVGAALAAGALLSPQIDGRRGAAAFALHRAQMARATALPGGTAHGAHHSG